MFTRRLDTKSIDFLIRNAGLSLSVGTNCGKYRPGPPDHGERTTLSLRKGRNTFWGIEVGLDAGSAIRQKDRLLQFFQPKTISINFTKRDDTVAFLSALRFCSLTLAKQLKTNGIEVSRNSSEQNAIEESIEVQFPWFDEDCSNWKMVQQRKSYLNGPTPLKDIPRLPEGPFMHPEREPIVSGRWKGASFLEFKDLTNISAMLFEHGSLATLDQIKLAFTADVLYHCFQTALSGLSLKHGDNVAEQLKEHIIDLSINAVLEGKQVQEKSA